MNIELRIYGTPKPGGSKTASAIYRGGKMVTKNGRPVIAMRDASKNADWKGSVRDRAALFMANKSPLDCPVRLEITFIMQRPKSHFNKKGMKPTAPYWHTNAPDATKLTRSTEDAMKGIVWRDDSLVAEQTIRKIYGEKPGAWIVITPLVFDGPNPIDTAHPVVSQLTWKPPAP